MACAQSSLQKITISSIKISSSRKTHFHGKLVYKTEMPEKVSKGKPFRVAHANFQDENSEIRMSFYGGQIDQYYKQLELHKSYDVRKFAVNTSEKKYTLLAHDFEVSPLAGNLTKIDLLPEDKEVKITAVEPSKIADLEHVGKDNLIDFLGVVAHVGEIQGPTTNSSRKRTIRIVDQTNTQIDTTLWGTAADEFSGSVNSVIRAKRFKKSDHLGHSLSSSQYSVIEINPSMPETRTLQEWYEKAKTSVQFRVLSTDVYKRQTLEEAQKTDKPRDFFMANVNIKSIGKRWDPFYMACIKCSKGVREQNDGTYLCKGAECDPQTTFVWRIILKAKLIDKTAQIDADLFIDASEKLLGLKVDDARTLYEDKTAEFFAKVDSVTGQQYDMKLRSKVNKDGIREYEVLEIL